MTSEMPDDKAKIPLHHLPQPSWREWLSWLLGRRRRLRVSGRSMLPTLKAGDLVFVDPRIYRQAVPRRGEIVVARHPYVKDTLLIKRVESVGEDGRCTLRSDNPGEGTDSRSFGALLPSQLIGRVTSRLVVS